MWLFRLIINLARAPTGDLLSQLLALFMPPSSLLAQGAVNISWEQVTIIAGAISGVVGSIVALFVKGVLRFGYQVDHDQELYQGRITDLEKRLLESRADGDKRVSEAVAASNQRFTETVTELRGQIIAMTGERDYYRNQAPEVMGLIKNLAGVVEHMTGEVQGLRTEVKDLREPKGG